MLFCNRVDITKVPFCGTRPQNNVKKKYHNMKPRGITIHYDERDTMSRSCHRRGEASRPAERNKGATGAAQSRTFTGDSAIAVFVLVTRNGRSFFPMDPPISTASRSLASDGGIDNKNDLNHSIIHRGNEDSAARQMTIDRQNHRSWTR